MKREYQLRYRRYQRGSDMALVYLWESPAYGEPEQVGLVTPPHEFAESYTGYVHDPFEEFLGPLAEVSHKMSAALLRRGYREE